MNSVTVDMSLIRKSFMHHCPQRTFHISLNESPTDPPVFSTLSNTPVNTIIHVQYLLKMKSMTRQLPARKIFLTKEVIGFACPMSRPTFPQHKNVMGIEEGISWLSIIFHKSRGHPIPRQVM